MEPVFSAKRGMPSTDSSSGDDAELVLQLVRVLIAEVQPHAAPLPLTLDRRFDVELGLGSLELVELLLRAEDAFGVALPSQLLGVVETPRDLLRAVRSAQHRKGAVPGVAPAGIALGGAPVPVAASTLVEALEWHVKTAPDRLHIRLLDESGVSAELSYADLHREAVSVASAVLARGVAPGQTVAIMLPTSRAYFVTFAGVLLAGAIPVPLYPPVRPSQLDDHLRRHARILANSGTSLLVTVPEAVPLGRALRSAVERLRHVVVPETLTGASRSALPAPVAHDVALLQYTSGSTGHPKGVILTHDNLLANIRALGQAAAVSGADTFVSWLPLYHDMGLIGAWLGSLYFGIPLAVLAPEVFLTRPARWLWAIHANRGTISAGPNFAFELCLTKINDAELTGLDLSSWRLAFNGAEPVSASTLERFAARFAPYGLRHEAITPVYGLAESSVGLTFPPLGRGPLIDRIARDVFSRSGRAVTVEKTDTNATRFVACGQPLRGHEVLIVDATGNQMGDRHEGHIEFRGPSATTGYYRNTDATRALFHGDWLDTGDLGYLAEGDLYVTGRVKDVVIRAGRSLHPAELEEAIGNITGIRKGCVAVFASADPERGTERLVVLAETSETGDDTTDEIRAHIIATTIDLLGTPPDEIVLAPPRTVLKTSSGKIRRAASRQIYEHGRIGARTEAAWRQLARFRLRAAMGAIPRAHRVVATVAFSCYAWAAFAAVGLALFVLLAVVPRQQWRWRMAPVRSGRWLDSPAPR